MVPEGRGMNSHSQTDRTCDSVRFLDYRYPYHYLTHPSIPPHRRRIHSPVDNPQSTRRGASAAGGMDGLGTGGWR